MTNAGLVADGMHARTDGFTSLAVVAAALGVIAGFPLADPIVGLFITVAILFVLKGAATLLAVPGVRAVEELRLRWAGHRLRAEAGLLVDEHLDLVAAHAIAVRAEHEPTMPYRG